MTSHRVLPPASGATTTVNGRTYSCAAGAAIDVPDFDALELEANGWLIAAKGGAGTTATRPSTPPFGLEFHDTTLGYNVRWDGKHWRNPTNGTAV